MNIFHIWRYLLQHKHRLKGETRERAFSRPYPCVRNELLERPQKKNHFWIWVFVSQKRKACLGTVVIFQGFATIALLLAHAPFISYQFLHRTSYCSSRILRPLKIFKDSFNVSGKCTFSAIDFYQMAKCSYHSYKHPPNSAQCSQCSEVISRQSGTDRSNWPPTLKYLKYLSFTINNEQLNSKVTSLPPSSMKEEENTFYNYKSNGGEQFVWIELEIKGSLIICPINFPSLDVRCRSGPPLSILVSHPCLGQVHFH